MKNANKNFLIFIFGLLFGIFLTFFIPNFNKINENELSRGYVGFNDTLELKEKKLKLDNELNNLFKEYQRNIRNLSIAKNQDINSQIISRVQELNQLELALNLNEATGEGIEIILNDANLNFGEYVQIQNLVHNYDVLYLVNELKTAGAEAISINNVRLAYNSDIICIGNFLGISGQKIYAPFVIDAIGDKTVLKEYLFRSGGLLQEFTSQYRKLQVEVILKDDLVLSKYIGELHGDNLKTYESR